MASVAGPDLSGVPHRNLCSPPATRECCVRFLQGLLGSLHRRIHVNILARSRAQRSAQDGSAAILPSSPSMAGPGCRALPDAQFGQRRVRAAWTPGARGAGGLEAFVCRSAGRGPGVASGEGIRARAGRWRRRPARPGPGGRGAGARAASWRGGRLTSPGTAPSTPSRYSGTARAAAGRCWRRGRCRRPSASRCTGCTPAPRRAG